MATSGTVQRRTTGGNRRRLFGRLLLIVAAIMVLADCSRQDNTASAERAEESDPAVDTTDDGTATTESASPPPSTEPGQTPDEPTDGEPNGTGPEMVAAFAEAVDAGLVVTRPEPDRILVWHDGTVTEQPINPMEWVWSDGRFIYRQGGEDGETVAATASTPDGTVVCDVDGPIHHVTERSDGSHVAAVEEQENVIEWNQTGETAVPLHAVDCRTGERTPIEPVSFYGNEVGGRAIERISGREFTLVFDVEGNAQVFNEGGVELNGEDYSGYATFNQDATVVVYGDMGAGAGPHYSQFLVARDTTSGDLLWRTDLGTIFTTFHFVGDTLVVQLPEDPTAAISGEPTGTTAVVLDATTGQPQNSIDLPFETLFVG